MSAERIKELLGVGLPNNVVASAVGVTDSYISQLLADPEFAAEVTQLKLINLTETAARDKKYNSLEDKLLEKLENVLPYLVKPMEVLAAIKTINSAVRRAAPSELAGQANVQVVQLQLPDNSAFAARFVINKESQVVEIAGRSLATMPAKGVVAKLQEAKKNAATNTTEHAADMENAKERLSNLQSLMHLPVAEVL